MAALGGLRRRLAALFALVAVVLLALGVLAAVAVAGVQEGQRRVMDEVFAAVRADAAALATAVEQEAAVSGYLLTADDAFLAEDDAARRAHDRAAARALAAVEDLPGVRAAVLAREEALGRWREDFAEPAVALVRAPGTAAVDPAEVQRGRGLFDDYRAASDEAAARLLDARETAVSDYERAFERLRWALRGTLLLILAVAGLLWWALRAWVLRPLEELAARTRAVAAGDLATPVQASGPTEVVRLAGDVESMRRRIVDELHEVALAGRELEHAYGELEAQAEDLRRSNAELEQFAYVASHDLQEPLRKVASFTQMLQRRYEGQLDERADQYIAFAVDGAKRMQRLINDLLAFSRVGRVTTGWREVDLDDALRQALASLSTAVEESGAEVTADPLPVVRGEAGLLVQVLQNLLGNALKFRGEEPPRVHVGCREEDGAYELCLRDNGIGIDPRFADKVFVIFQRLHPREEYEGSGIGLALCRKIVEYHGGRLWLDVDAPGPGTTFRLTLPVPEAAPGRTAPDRAQPSHPAGATSA